MWRTCLHQSQTLFFLKLARRHCVKQYSLQNALVNVGVLSVNSFGPVFWHQAHTMTGPGGASGDAAGLSSAARNGETVKTMGQLETNRVHAWRSHDHNTRDLPRSCVRDKNQTRTQPQLEPHVLVNGECVVSFLKLNHMCNTVETSVHQLVNAQNTHKNMHAHRHRHRHRHTKYFGWAVETVWTFTIPQKQGFQEHV